MQLAVLRLSFAGGPTILMGGQRLFLSGNPAILLVLSSWLAGY